MRYADGRRTFGAGADNKGYFGREVQSLADGAWTIRYRTEGQIPGLIARPGTTEAV